MTTCNKGEGDRENKQKGGARIVPCETFPRPSLSGGRAKRNVPPSPIESLATRHRASNSNLRNLSSFFVRPVLPKRRGDHQEDSRSKKMHAGRGTYKGHPNRIFRKETSGRMRTRRRNRHKGEDRGDAKGHLIGNPIRSL